MKKKKKNPHQEVNDAELIMRVEGGVLFCSQKRNKTINERRWPLLLVQMLSCGPYF